MGGGCLRLARSVLLEGASLAAVIWLLARTASGRLYLYPGWSFLAGLAFLALAVLIPLGLMSAASGAGRITDVTSIRLSLHNVPLQAAGSPGVGCALVAALPALVVLALLGLVLLANGLTVGLFNANIAGWLFAGAR
jgi:hypothetical protein